MKNSLNRTTTEGSLMYLIHKAAFCIFFFLILPNFAYAEERINIFSSHIIINDNGSFTVQEEIAYDFGDGEHHGIYREIPLVYKPTGSKYESHMQLSSISVTDGHGNLRQTSYDEGGNFITLKIGDPDTLVTGQQFYVIRYTVWGGLTAGLTKDEIYWNVTGNGWNVPIDHVRADVVLPMSLAPSKVSLSCQAGEMGYTVPCQATSTESVATGTINMIRFEQRDLLSKQGLAIAVGIQKGLIHFTQAPDGKQQSHVTNAGIVKWWQKPFLDISLALPVIIFTLMLNLWWKKHEFKKKKRTQKGNTSPNMRTTYMLAGGVLVGVSFFVPSLNLSILCSGIIIFCFGLIHER